MQIKIIGSHQCPDTLYALHVLAEKGYEVDFVDILGSHAVSFYNIKRFSP